MPPVKRKQLQQGTLDVRFNWNKCPKKFRATFKRDSESNKLILMFKDIQDEDVSCLIAFLKRYQNITKLDFSLNTISYGGIKALASNLALTTLNIEHCDLRDRDVEAFAGNTVLTVLKIGYNNIGAAGAAFLARNRTLKELDISGNDIGDAGAEALAGNTVLRSLNVFSSKISAVGAKCLAGNTTLRTLMIGYNMIGAVGAKALADSKMLTTLGIYWCGVDDAGAEAFEHNRTLTILDVSGNNIGVMGAKVLLQFQQNRNHAFTAWLSEKFAFLMGTHHRLGAKSPVLRFSQGRHRDCLRKIFEFLESRPLHLEHHFTDALIAAAFPNNGLSQEIKEKHEIEEIKEQQKNNAMVQSLTALNSISRSLAPDVSDRELKPVTLVFSGSAPSSASSLSATTRPTSNTAGVNDDVPEENTRPRRKRVRRAPASGFKL